MFKNTYRCVLRLKSQRNHSGSEVQSTVTLTVLRLHPFRVAMFSRFPVVCRAASACKKISCDIIVGRVGRRGRSQKEARVSPGCSLQRATHGCGTAPRVRPRPSSRQVEVRSEAAIPANSGTQSDHPPLEQSHSQPNPGRRERPLGALDSALSNDTIGCALYPPSNSKEGVVVCTIPGCG